MKKATLLVAAVLALAAVPAAAAHVTANPPSGEAGGFAMIAFRVPHGCEESPTTSLTIKIPTGVASVAPQAVPGWKVTTKEGKLPEAVEAHGETITEGILEVTWTGGPLDAHQFTDFGLSMLLPDRAGETIHFPAIQRCRRGETRWIQIPEEGEPEPDEPAPSLELMAGGDGHGSSGSDGGDSEGGNTDTSDEPASAEESGTQTGSESDSESDDDMSGSEMAAMGMGGAGLVAGIAALIATRRRPRA